MMCAVVAVLVFRIYSQLGDVFRQKVWNFREHFLTTVDDSVVTLARRRTHDLGCSAFAPHYFFVEEFCGMVYKRITTFITRLLLKTIYIICFVLFYNYTE